MFNNKLNEFFSIEDKSFKKRQKKRLQDNTQLEEYRNGLL
jgi:hypothetical protein